MKFLRPFALYLAWLIALVGVLISLYFSEIKQMEPCRFCWYQRIALFPLALQLGIATYFLDRKGALYYGIPLCLVGFFVAIFQSLDLWLHIHGICGPGVSCREEVIYLFNVIPFPLISAAGFLAIAGLIFFSRPNLDIN